jgi:hypothetical protein
MTDTAVATPTLVHPKIIKPGDRPYLRLLVFAPYQSGKTTLLGTAHQDPRTSPHLVLDFEGNTSVLLGCKNSVGEEISIWPMRSASDLNEAFAYLHKGDHPFKSCSIDSLTEINWYFLSTEMDRRVQLAGGEGSRATLPDQSQIQDYGAILVQQRRLVRRFNTLPLHIIYTALDFQEAVAGEGEVTKPAMQGNFRNEVGGLMDVVGYLSLDEKKKDENDNHPRIMYLHDVPRLRARIRTEWGKANTIPKKLENPTVTKLLNVAYPNLTLVKETTNA